MSPLTSSGGDIHAGSATHADRLAIGTARVGPDLAQSWTSKISEGIAGAAGCKRSTSGLSTQPAGPSFVPQSDGSDSANLP